MFETRLKSRANLDALSQPAEIGVPPELLVDSKGLVDDVCMRMQDDGLLNRASSLSGSGSDGAGVSLMRDSFFNYLGPGLTGIPTDSVPPFPRP